MLFYKIEGMLVNNDPAAEDSRRAQRDHARKLYMKTERYNQKHGHYCFVAGCADGLLTVGVISGQQEKILPLVQAFLKAVDMPVTDMTVDEITLASMEQLLCKASRFKFIEDDDEIKDKYGISRVTGRHGRCVEFGENLITESSRKEIFENTERFLLNGSLVPELERIYSGAPSVKPLGHPVHYMIQTDNTDTRRETYRLLLQALYNNKRISSKRYCYLDFRPGEDFSVMVYDALYHVCAGGAVIVRYLPNNDLEESRFASSEQETIEKICQVAKRHRNQVLTVICLPRECKNAKKLFYESLGSMAFVEICEDFAKGEQACSFLKMLAREHHIRTDKALFSRLEQDKGYLASQLYTIFDEWYNNKLKTSVYPQYKDLKVARQEAVKAAPKGSAYDNLQAMIGLTEAKAVIRKALNYYKMQKLYEEKGMKQDTPAMHMVFTGNPGTAKTTAARLFARIMADNGLLSKGQLVEVGRGDLVGKYVGWTAKTVQEKFKQAIGGVLFIDEAYSLVDGHSGSYGDEAINTIVQEMENHREDVVVIFAGYPNEMEQFLLKNPGLRSRIAFHVPFADYTPQELCDIAVLMGKHKGVTFEDDALKKLGVLFDSATKQVGFGNGRYVRNILEQAKMNQATRLLEYEFDQLSTEDITTIKAEDILAPEFKAEAKRTIGFAC